jgi:hypothetical protein
MRSLATAKEHAERSLEQSQATIRQLQTTLGHEGLASDEAIGRASADGRAVEQALQAVRTELASEKVARERAEQALRDARVTITNLTEKLHDAQRAGLRIDAESASRTAHEAVGQQPMGDREETTQTVRRPRGRAFSPCSLSLLF